MKIKKVSATINGININRTLSDGVNFLFYKNESEKKFYKKTFELAFDENYNEDDFYKKNDVEVRIEITDANIDYTLIYGKAEFCGDRELMEGFLIEGKYVNVYCNEICEGFIKSYLKKNGIDRIFDCDEDYLAFRTPKDILDKIEKKKKEGNEIYLSELYGYIKNIEPVSIDKRNNCRLMLLSNGEFFLQGEDDDDDEQFVLAKYFEFAISAQISDRFEYAYLCASGYPLFVCELFEMLGDSADITEILKILQGYRGQVIFLCPEKMKTKLENKSVVRMTEEIRKSQLQF